MKFRILKAFSGYKPGQFLTIKTDAHDLPVDKFWRGRLRDAANDECIERVISTIEKDKTIQKRKKQKRTAEDTKDD